jgi:hypothetical protein
MDQFIAFNLQRSGDTAITGPSHHVESARVPRWTESTQPAVDADAFTWSAWNLTPRYNDLHECVDTNWRGLTDGVFGMKQEACGWLARDKAGQDIFIECSARTQFTAKGSLIGARR